MDEQKKPGLIRNLYENKYKQITLITVILLIGALCVLGYWKVTTGEFISKDISLKGGLLITIQTDRTINIDEATQALEKELGASATIKGLKTLGSDTNIGYSFEVEKLSNTDAVKSSIEKASGLKLEEGKYTIEEQSSALGSAFFTSTIKALIIAFVCMSIVVFVYFKAPAPSLAVILAGFSDVIETIAIMNLFGIKLSTGGVAALLMILGYSVDTDILLSTRVLKRTEGTVMDRVYSSLKTGLTMQITAIVALGALWALTPALMLKQIALIIIIGLFWDIFNTWIQNAAILRWYMEHKNVKV